MHAYFCCHGITPSKGAFRLNSEFQWFRAMLAFINHVQHLWKHLSENIILAAMTFDKTAGTLNTTLVSLQLFRICLFIIIYTHTSCAIWLKSTSSSPNTVSISVCNFSWTSWWVARKYSAHVNTVTKTEKGKMRNATDTFAFRFNLI